MAQAVLDLHNTRQVDKKDFVISHAILKNAGGHWKYYYNQIFINESNFSIK